MATNRLSAGALDHRVTFQSPVQERDADGQLHQGWETAFEAWAAVKYLRGTEAVMQARMQSRSPAILTIRNSEAARRVTSEWRVKARDRSGVERMFEVKEDWRPTEGAGFLEMLVEA